MALALARECVRRCARGKREENPGRYLRGSSGEPMGTERQEGGLLGCAPRSCVSTAGLQLLQPWLGDSLSDQRGASRLVTEVWDRKDLQPWEEILRTLEAA